MNHHLLILILVQITFCSRYEVKGSTHNENISNQKLNESHKQMLFTSNIESPFDLMTTETGIALKKSISYQSQPLWSDLFKPNAVERKNFESTDQCINHDSVNSFHRNNLIQKLIAITKKPNSGGQDQKDFINVHKNSKPESFQSLPSSKQTDTFSSIPEVITFPSDVKFDHSNNSESSFSEQHAEVINDQYPIDDFIKKIFYTKITNPNSQKMAVESSKFNQTVPFLVNTMMNQERNGSKRKSDFKNLDLNEMTSSGIDSYLKTKFSRSDDIEPKWVEFNTNVNKVDPMDVTYSFSNYGDQGFDDYQSFLTPKPAFSNDDNFKSQFNNNSDLDYTDQQFDTFNDKKREREVHDLYEPKDGSSWDDIWPKTRDEDKTTNRQFTGSFYTATNQDYLEDTNLADQSPDNFETTEHDEIDKFENDQTKKRRVNIYDSYDPESLSQTKLFDSNADYNDVNKNYDYDENEAQYLPEGQYNLHQGHYKNYQYQDDNLNDEFPDYQVQHIFQAGQLNHNQNPNEQKENEQSEKNDKNENNPNRLDYKFMYSNNLMYVPNLSYLLRPKIKYVEEQDEKRLQNQKHQIGLIEKRKGDKNLRTMSVKKYLPELNAYSQIDYSKIPGQPIKDYPIYSKIPENAESLCKDKYPGYYANPNYQCQVYHYCNYLMTHSFLCPNGTVFNQNLEVCDWWFNVDCSGRNQKRTSFDL